MYYNKTALPMIKYTMYITCIHIYNVYLINGTTNVECTKAVIYVIDGILISLSN